MIQRRQFIGSIATICVASGSTAQLAHALASPIPDLSWNSQVVQTLPHNAANQPPVVTGVSLQTTGDLLAIVGDDHHVCVYDVRQQQYVQDLDRHTDWIRSTVFSPNGTMLATAGNDRTVCVWDCDDWNRPLWFKRQPEAVFHARFSNDGLNLATVGFDRWLRIYDAATGEQVTKLKCPCPDIHAVAYSAGDQLIAAGGRCGTIRVWNSDTSTKVGEFNAHRKRIRSIEFAPDNMILSAGDDQVVRITDAVESQTSRSLPRHASKLYATALLDRNLIATAGSDNLIHIWQLSDLKKLGSLRGHTGTVTSLDYSGNQLVSGSYDTHVRIWSTEQHTSATPQRHTDLTNGWSQKLK